MNTISWFSWHDDTLVLSVRVQPKSSRDDISGENNDQLKIRITAPPVDGQANEHLIRLLAKWFDVPRARITLLRGETGRTKLIAIEAPCRFPAADDLFVPVSAARPK